MIRQRPPAMLARLGRSEFRSTFRLLGNEAATLSDSDAAAVRRQARSIVERRLAIGCPANDGRQTPYRGHPVFVAQHATATCCRSCMAKWHGVAKNRAMNAEEVDFAVGVICAWLEARRLPSCQLVLDLSPPA